MKRLALTFLMVLSLYGGVTLAGAQPALAQGSGHNHGSGPHGGQIGDAEPFHVEMVANKSQLDIYLYDQNMKPLRLDQFEVSATIKAGKEREKIGFIATGGNQMKGVSDLMAKPGAKIIMLLKPKGKPQVQVRFGV